MRIIALSLISIVIAAGTASAGIFGPSDQEIQDTLKAYFNKPAAALSDYQALDLAVLKNDKDAYVLAVYLKRQVNNAQKAIDAEQAKLDTLEVVAEHYFTTLYRKEVHDEFWTQIRPAKQAAYREANAAARVQQDKVRQSKLTLDQAQGTLDTLRRVAGEFKEQAPSRR